MKKILKAVLPLCAMLTLLGSCSGNETSAKSALEAPSNFAFDFNNASYSFTGSPNATFYSVKVYEKDSDGAIQPHAVASSGMIRATEDNAAYTGTMDYEFLAGDYQAVIKAIAPRYKVGSATYDGKSTMLGTPTVTAYWKEEGGVSIDLTITAGDTITTGYTVSITDNSTSSVVYSNAAATAGSLNLTASDLTNVAELTTSLDYTVSVQGNAVEGYTQAKAVTTKVSKQNGGNNPGGPGGDNTGGPGGGFTLSVSDVSIDIAEASGTFKLSGQINCTATKETPTTGLDYYYTFSDGNAVTGDLNFKTGGEFTMTANGGPFSNSTGAGTWTLTGNALSFTLA